LTLPDVTRMALIGAGNMGYSLLLSLNNQSDVSFDVTIVEPNPSDNLQALCNKKGFTLLSHPTASSSSFDIVMLAVKPQMIEAGIHAANNFIGRSTLLISILAGKTLAEIEKLLLIPIAVIRAMPNTPISVGRGVTGLFANTVTRLEHRHLAEVILSSASTVEWLSKEDDINALTAVSGSGPAYVFYLVECLTQAGVNAGLPADLAKRIARKTIEGAGELLFQSPEITATTLRQNVTSPGGTTEAALSILMRHDGLESLMTTAVNAARDRARALSK
jgi:pyrroline-5-carboxylate reductase